MIAFILTSVLTTIILFLQMISAEAPVLFAKAAEIFINELSLRAWVHTEDNKRRTLQRNDIAMAITKYDQFDFLIDIVPRDEIKPPAKRSNSQSSGNISLTDALQTDQVQYVVQHPAFQSTTAPGQPIQLLQTPAGLQVAGAGQTQFALSGQQLLQLQVPSNAAGDASTPASSTGQIQYQIMTANGEVQSIPIQLNQMLRMQPGLTGQPILIQSPGGPASYQIASQGGQQFLVAGQPTTAVGTQEDEAGLEETDN